MSKNVDYAAVLKSEMGVAFGCTEPISVAYAASLARSLITEYPIDKIHILASGNIIKNAMAVIIPGTSEYGVLTAAALGAIAGDAAKGLSVLETVNPEQVEEAKRLCEDRVYLETSGDLPLLYVDVTVSGGGHSGRAVLQNYHDCIVLLERDGSRIIEKDMSLSDEENRLTTQDIEDILDYVDRVDIKELDIIEKSIELNTKISEEGLSGEYGLSVGKTLLAGEDDLISYAAALTAAGSDARMAGAPLPAVSNSGSGNQGICAIMPVVAAARVLKAPHEKLLRGGALSNLITIHVKKSFGRLSPLCGAVAAGIGASTGIVYLMGGGIKEVRAAIQNTFGNITGMICDGAKAGCAMKVSTAVFAAVQSALIAMRGGEVKPIEGIIEYDVEDTISNMSRISKEGMPNMDPLLLNIMINKKTRDNAELRMQNAELG